MAPRVLSSLLLCILGAAALWGCTGQRPTVRSDEVVTPAQVDVWLHEALAAARREDYATAIPLFRKAADAGNIQSMHLLGFHYENGEGIDQDYAAAMKWYRKVADAEHVKADDRRFVPWSTRHVGGLYAGGHGVPRDGDEAMKWYRKAAAEGDGLAMSNIGALLANGDLVPRDYVEAMKWFRKAADAGESMAMLNVGLLYDNGHGVPKDSAEAAKWYQRAADTWDPRVREAAHKSGVELPPASNRGK